MKVVPIPRHSVLGRTLRKRVCAALDDYDVSRAGASRAPAADEEFGARSRLPHMCVDRLPGAFALAASSVTLWGVDLPNLLPHWAAAPQRHGLLSVQEDMQQATAELSLIHI